MDVLYVKNIANHLAQQIDNSQPSQEHFDFLLEVLQTIGEGGEKKQVYSLLEQRIHLLDSKLSQALQIWSSSPF